MLGESSAPLESGVATERATPQLWIGVGALAIAAALLSPYRNFLSDDGYIYLRFVRNFTEYGTFSYNGSTPTYGMTSPAWVVLVSLVHRLVGDPWIASKVVSWALTAACLWLFYLLAFRFVRSSLWAGLATVALALDPWFAKWTLSGLENPLTLTAMFGGLLLYQRARNTDQLPIAGFLLFGLCVLCRPEMALLCLVVAGDVLLFERRHKVRKLVVGGALMALPVIGWLVYAQLQFGTFIPNTITAKRVTFEHKSSYLSSIVRVAKLLAGSAAPHLGIAGIAGLFFWRRRSDRPLASRLPWSQLYLPFAWCCALVGFYIVGKTMVAGRYILAMTPLLIILGFAALEAVLRASETPRPRRQLVLGAFCTLLFLQLAVLQARYTLFVTQWPRGMDENFIEIGEWLRDNTPPDAVVATGEIGVPGYFSERPLIDLLGLVSPEVIPHLRDRSVPEYLLEAEPDYLVIEGRGPLRNPELRARSELLFERPVQREGSSERDIMTTFSLYRLHHGASASEGASPP